MLENKILKFGIVGHGHIGKRHALMIRNNPYAEVTAVCDIKEKEDAGLEEFHGNYYKDIDEMLKAEPDLDVVTVATPNGLHEIHALKVISQLIL